MAKKVIGVVLIFVLFGFPCGSWALENPQKTILATQIIDQNVYGSEGKKIGEIDDIIVKRNGKINKVTIDVGGFLGIGEKVVAYPFDELTIEKGRILVQTTEAKLTKRPEYSYYLHRLSRGYYYGLYPPHTPPALGPTYGPGYGPYFGPEWRRRFQGGMWAYSPGRFLASVVIGRDVVNNMGENIGQIRDLLISDKGQVEKIVVFAGDILGDDAYVALPYKALSFDYYGAVYPVTLDELKKMPKYPYGQ